MRVERLRGSGAAGDWASLGVLGVEVSGAVGIWSDSRLEPGESVSHISLSTISGPGAITWGGVYAVLGAVGV